MFLFLRIFKKMKQVFRRYKNKNKDKSRLALIFVKLRTTKNYLCNRIITIQLVTASNGHFAEFL